MNKLLGKPGQAINVQPINGVRQERSQKIALVKTKDMEIAQFIIPVNESIPTHEAQGEVALHCLTGRVSIAALGEDHELSAGQLLYLSITEPFSVLALETASLLVTIVSAKHGPNVELIGD